MGQGAGRLALGQNFRARGVVVSFGVGRVAELVDVEIAVLGGQAFSHVLVVVRMAFAHIGPGGQHLGAHGPKVKDLLLGHLVGNDDHQAVALLGGGQGEPEAGVAGGGLDDCAAGL